MSIIIKATPRDEFLFVEAAGEFSLDESTRTFGMVIDLVEANHSKKVLFDGREITGNPTAVERYYYAAFAADAVRMLKDHGWLVDTPRFAYVLKVPLLDRLRMGQIIARKRDMNVKAFENVDDAMRWLRLDSDDLRYWVE